MTESDEATRHDPFPPLDTFLTTFQAMAESDGVISVTLFVEGATISGTIISMEKFFRGSLKDHQAVLTGLGDIVKAPSGEDAPMPDFLHLGDVQILSGGRFMKTPFARVMITRISGWFFGAMGEK